MYTTTELGATVDRAFARQNAAECTWINSEGYECGAAAVVLLLPDGDEARCREHVKKGLQA
jgi:hypothetical protein